jgi:hypothetical protein
MSSRVPATYLWLTTEALAYVGADILTLSRTLGPRLEEALFDPVADAGVERTLAELVRRGCGWDAYDRPAAVELVTQIEEYVLPPMRERHFIERIESCQELMDVLAHWTYVMEKEIERATPDELAERTQRAAYGTEVAVQVLAAAARLVGDANPAVARMLAWMPVRGRDGPPTVH